MADAPAPPTSPSPRVDLTVRVFREPGALLGRFAHDLELRVEKLRVVTALPAPQPARVEVVFAADSLRVIGALSHGSVNQSALAAAERAEIERNIKRDVLKAARYPEGRFTGEFELAADRAGVRGKLELCGQNRELAFELIEHAGTFRGKVSLQPSRWGIEPFRALLGALKLQDRVEVAIDVELPRLAPVERHVEA